MTDAIGHLPTFLHIGDYRASMWRVRNKTTGEFVPAIWADADLGVYCIYARNADGIPILDPSNRGKHVKELVFAPIEFVPRKYK